MSVMPIAELSVVANEAEYLSEAPAPELSYTAKVTPLVLGSEEDHSDQPAELITSLMVDFWKTT